MSVIAGSGILLSVMLIEVPADKLYVILLVVKEEPRTGPKSRGKDPIFTTQGTLLVLKDAVVTEIVEEDLEP